MKRKSTSPVPVQSAQSLPTLILRHYQELRRVAAHIFYDERPEHTLQPTALVHEAFVRLSEGGPKRYLSRAHFFGVVSRAMRQILIEHARKHTAQKRGGAWQRVSLDEADLVGFDSLTLIELDAALVRLQEFDPRLGRIADLRLFAGLSTVETAILLRRGESTVRRDWGIAKAWLKRELEPWFHQG